MGTRVCDSDSSRTLVAHTETSELTRTRAEKTSDSTRTRVLGLVNNHVFCFFWHINIEETLKRLTSLISFPPFCHGNKCITQRVHASRTLTSDDVNTMATGTPAAAAILLFTFGYKNFKQDGCNKRSADCKVCGIKIKDAGSTTSNLIRHLKTLPDRYVKSQ